MNIYRQEQNSEFNRILKRKQKLNYATISEPKNTFVNLIFFNT